MIAIVKNDTIVSSPAAWTPAAVLELLYIQGCTMVDGGLRGPGGEALALPDAEPTEALTLAGLRILPVVVLPANPPEGQLVTGQEDVLLEDRVERRPVYGDIPQSPPVSLEDAKAAKQAEITAGADAILAPLGAEYGVYERQTWDQQAAQAAALQTDSNADAPLVRAIASARGMDVIALAGRILANKTAWEAISGYVVGQRLGYQDRLDALGEGATANDVAAIEVAYTLPS